MAVLTILEYRIRGFAPGRSQSRPWMRAIRQLIEDMFETMYARAGCRASQRLRSTSTSACWCSM